MEREGRGRRGGRKRKGTNEKGRGGGEGRERGRRKGTDEKGGAGREGIGGKGEKRDGLKKRRRGEKGEERI